MGGAPPPVLAAPPGVSMLETGAMPDVEPTDTDTPKRSGFSGGS